MKKYSKLSILIMAIVLVILVGISITWGRYPISLKAVFGILASRLFGNMKVFWNATQEGLVMNFRLPRTLVACFIGAALSSAGASYQGVFQNPMAAPDLLGASSGAALGATMAILLNMSNSMITIFAFLFGMATVLLVVFIGDRVRGKRAVSLILAGIMIGSLSSSGVSYIKLVADPNEQLPKITYWLMGSLNGVEPKDVLWTFIPITIGLLPLLILSWRINILTLGDDEAKALGINTRLLRIVVIICATLVTASSVAVSGMIGWIGLVIPHMARKVVGNNYVKLLPASILMGSIFLLLVDDISRNLYTNEIPIGILTSFIGAPFFIYLIIRDSKTL